MRMLPILLETALGTKIEIDSLFLTASREIRDSPSRSSNQAMDKALAVLEKVVELEAMEANNNSMLAEEYPSLRQFPWRTWKVHLILLADYSMCYLLLDPSCPIYLVS